jgi:hypothetical protein
MEKKALLLAAVLLTLVLISCSSLEEQESPRYDQAHPSTELSDSFFPGAPIPQREPSSNQFFSKKCSPQSASDHYSKTEYFCDSY